MPLLPPGVHADFPPERDRLTPLFRQYVSVKEEQPGLLLYRLGDFYEMFGPDAVRGAEILGLTLTSRACFQGYKVAMCGIPHHAGARYIKRLVKAGETVAICEQIEDPSQAKGLVERAVTRVITAGTLVEDEYLSADSNNFMAVIAQRGSKWGVALLESSGGSVELYEPAVGNLRQLAETVRRHHAAEILVPGPLRGNQQLGQLASGSGGCVLHGYDALPGEQDVEYFLKRYFDVGSLSAFGLTDARAAQAALFALIRYLKETFRIGQVQLYPRLVPPEGHLYLDTRAVSHMELLSGLNPQRRGMSLYSQLNRCQTAAGRRELQARLMAPYADPVVIEQRHDSVELLFHKTEFSKLMQEQLQAMQDVERITQRVSLRRTHPKELRALVDSLPALSNLSRLLANSGDKLLAELGMQIGNFGDMHESLDGRLADEPPVKPSDGGVIREGADEHVDRLRELVGGGKDWFSNYQERERERTGIRTLKVKQTGAFGYFIEVSKANLALVPEDYSRKQTLVNAERFVTEELKARETEMQTAEARLLKRESELLEGMLSEVTDNAGRLAGAARAAAVADVLLSLALVAREQSWARPQLAKGGAEGAGAQLKIRGGRHPVVEQAVGTRYYTRNDCYLDSQAQQIILLTGPNMGGKSTYLRMVALIAIINQLGGFVPAESAVLPVFSRIYTRVGAQDYLALGQSTFMVEMVETAEILNTCSGTSLILLDEVGRGTSTYDGISIAKAVVEYLHELPSRPLTLFATHFFELTDLEIVLERARNFQVEVSRDRDEFVFLYRVSPGAASDSYGIEVAALAGLPEEVVGRARQILKELEDVKDEARQRARRAVQLGLFGRDRPEGTPT